MRTKENKAITLISLVITIVVLLILAGISISTLTGENGVIQKAQYARTKYEESAQNEVNILNGLSEQINELSSNKEETYVTLGELKEKKITYTVYSNKTTGSITNASNMLLTIPCKFGDKIYLNSEINSVVKTDIFTFGYRINEYDNSNTVVNRFTDNTKSTIEYEIINKDCDRIDIYLAYAYKTIDSNYTETFNIKNLIAKSKKKISDTVDSNSAEISYNYTVNGLDGNQHIVYNPYKNGGAHQYAGQLHCHGSDYGTLYDTHVQVGYSFMTISDYGDKKGIVAEPEGKSGLLWIGNSYEARINGNETSTGEHIVVWDTDKVHSFNSGTMPQEVINTIRAEGKYCAYAHPFYQIQPQSVEKIKTVKSECRFIEIYNGVVARENQNTNNDEFGLDTLLTQGNLTFGIAVSDTHNDSSGYVKNGCVYVFSDKLDKASIWKALLDGNFYASNYTGDAVINNVSITNEEYIIETGDENASVSFYKENGTLIETIKGNTVRYRFKGDEKYVRAKVTLSKSYTWHPYNLYVWTQPVIFKN